MKTKRFLGIVVLAGIVILAMGCKNKTNSEVEIPATLSNGVTKVYADGVTLEQRDTAVATLNTMYSTFNEIQAPAFDTKAKVFIIKPSGTAISHSGTNLTIPYDAPPAQIGPYLLSNDFLSLLYPSNGVYLAYQQITVATRCA
jgi:hypothetical protein